jgi:hypothetical protein
MKSLSSALWMLTKVPPPRALHFSIAVFLLTLSRITFGQSFIKISNPRFYLVALPGAMASVTIFVYPISGHHGPSCVDGDKAHEGKGNKLVVDRHFFGKVGRRVGFVWFGGRRIFLNFFFE